MIKAVLFDVDGVLVDSIDANYKFFGDLLRKFGYKFMTKDEYAPLFHAPMKDIIKISTRLNDEKEIEKIWTAGKAREVPYPDNLVKAPDNLEEIIKLLNSKYELGIVSGRVRNSIYSLHDIGRLKQFFTVDVSYEDTMEHKPHPEPLLLAAEKLGILPRHCIYIGDTEFDMIAAKTAGMKFILYSNIKIDGADVCVRSFREIPAAIMELSDAE